MQPDGNGLRTKIYSLLPSWTFSQQKDRTVSTRFFHQIAEKKQKKSRKSEITGEIGSNLQHLAISIFAIYFENKAIKIIFHYIFWANFLRNAKQSRLSRNSFVICSSSKLKLLFLSNNPFTICFSLSVNSLIV